jgi:hypothetical protein
MRFLTLMLSASAVANINRCPAAELSVAPEEPETGATTAGHSQQHVVSADID